jgi:DNA polymerase III epsilon subunit-like protein
MENIMIDIETLGTSPGCALLSLAAVKFDIKTGEAGETFYQTIDLNSCIDSGLTICPDTFKWWLCQSREAQNDLLSKEGLKLPLVLQLFSNFITEDQIVWGNSARFDLGILEYAYKSVNIPVPWKSWNERCVRTLSSLYPDVKKNEKREGIHHNPLDDCLFQIKYLSKIYQKAINQG